MNTRSSMGTVVNDGKSIEVPTSKKRTPGGGTRPDWVRKLNSKLIREEAIRPYVGQTQVQNPVTAAVSA